MSISKFSKNLLIVTPDFKSYKEIDTYNQNIANKVIEHLISRLTKLGFHSYFLLGDDSLSLEVNDELANYGSNVKVIDMYPNTAKDFLLNNVIIKSRSKFINTAEPLTVSDKKAKDLQMIEMKLSKLLSGTVKLNESVPTSEKVEIIRRVLMLKFFGYPISETTLYKYDKEYFIFLMNVKKTAEDIEEMIIADIDHQWEWAQNLLKYEYDTGIKVDEEDDEEVIDLMELLGGFTEREKESTINFDIDTSKIEFAQKPEVPEQEQLSEISLTEGLATLTKKDALQSEALMVEMTKAINLIDDYTDIIYSHLIDSVGLIIDLQVSSTAARSRKLPYKNTELNKMILNVDLRTGEVELFFKGSLFKLNSFFEKGETVKTNLLEW